ncbi:MAG: hypothetical protein DRH04_02225 [Deltaproteobacteria bacterium]|nr:MAG: hypothetical protein DRH04_02225 [Deltaproteobacteria bacterium]
MFDEKNVALRSGVSGMDSKAILELDDQEIEDAIFMPKTASIAKTIFSFLVDFHSSCLVFGMAGVSGFDRDKLERLAERRGIDPTKYDIMVGVFEERLMRSLTSKD